MQLRELLNDRGVLLADGATGTNFFNMGLQSGDAPELWNQDEPDRVLALHTAFVEAGADIILTNTFGANARRLMLHDAQDRVREINIAAARLARRAGESVDRPVIVAGSVGPTGDLFAPLGPLTEEEAVVVFAEQIAGLKEGGADVAWIETMSSEEEIRAATKAAREAGMDYVFTASFDTAGRTMMGVSPSRLPGMAGEMEPAPVAVGANCGVGATDLLFSILDMTDGDGGPRGELAFIAKANCGVPRVSGDKVVYTGTPETMAAYVRMAVDAGVRIIGGCCGTSPDHLAAMRRAMDDHRRGERPTLNDIVAATGEMVNKPKQAGETPARPRRGRRR